MTAYRNLEAFLRAKAEELHPAVGPHGFDEDGREYVENENPAALTEAWLEEDSTYIWKVGLLAQWDSNKCDWAYLFIAHEREPGSYQFIGVFHWSDGENDDISRSLARYESLRRELRHPVFSDRD